MSMDYFVYLKNADEFSAGSFARYCESLGLQIHIHPSFSLLRDTGFVPMRLIDRRFRDDKPFFHSDTDTTFQISQIF